VLARAAEREVKGQPFWRMRVGIHTGPAGAGVIGKKKFAYDIWGDTVNLASRMEASGEPGKVNVSEDTYHRVKDLFVCEPRGKVSVKHKGEVEMYFVEKIKPEYSEQGEGLSPNAAFQQAYEKLEGLGSGRQ
jgi:class 3 adenylate cyclase